MFAVKDLVMALNIVISSVLFFNGLWNLVLVTGELNVADERLVGRTFIDQAVIWNEAFVVE